MRTHPQTGCFWSAAPGPEAAGRQWSACLAPRDSEKPDMSGVRAFFRTVEPLLPPREKSDQFLELSSGYHKHLIYSSPDLELFVKNV